MKRASTWPARCVCPCLVSVSAYCCSHPTPPPSNSVQSCYLDGKLMFDPLSLNDFPAIVAGAVTTVEVRVAPEE